MSTVAELQTTFDHASHFGSEALGEQALYTFQDFKATLRRTFRELVALGQRLFKFRDRCFDELGVVEGKKAFDDWLASDIFGGSRYLARGTMQLASWYQELPEKLQRLVRHNVATWNLSCLQNLTKIATTELEGFLKRVEQLMQAGGKITAEQIRASAQTTRPKTLILGQPASDADWQLVAEVYDLGEQLTLLKLEAKRHAEINPDTGEREITTDSVVEALKSFNLNPALVLPKPKTERKRYTQDEVEQIRQEVQEQVQSQYQAQLAESEARSQQHLAKAIALKEVQMQQALSSKDKHIEAVAAQKVKLEQENASLKQQLAQFQSEQPVVPTSQRNKAKSANISGADSVSVLNDIESSVRSPIALGENPRANPLEVAQTLSELEISDKSSSLANLVGNHYNQIPSNVPLKIFRKEHSIGQRKHQNFSSTRGKGFGHR